MLRRFMNPHWPITTYVKCVPSANDLVFPGATTWTPQRSCTSCFDALEARCPMKARWKRRTMASRSSKTPRSSTLKLTKDSSTKSILIILPTVDLTTRETSDLPFNDWRFTTHLKSKDPLVSALLLFIIGRQFWLKQNHVDKRWTLIKLWVLKESPLSLLHSWESSSLNQRFILAT